MPSFFDRLIPWYRRLPFLGLLRLNRFRDRMRAENLHDTETRPSLPLPPLPPPTPQQRHSRMADGTYNDLQKPRMGMLGARFGRNVPLDRVDLPTAQSLLTPNPREISNKLMKRDKFIAVEQLNLLAAAWIQFQVHDWFAHGTDKQLPPIEVPLPPGDTDWPVNPMHINRTLHDDTRPPADTSPLPTYRNLETHWWDGSQLYGSTLERQRQVRSFTDGKLTLGADGLLPLDEHGVDLTGVNANWWVGLSLLHTLFTMEHNAICDRLKTDNPAWSDEELFQHARLVNAAVMAKIHTIEWTPRILLTETLKLGMNQNWTRVRQSKQEHHAAPYSMTEEFVAVYRMHPLLPDDYQFHALDSGQLIQQQTLTEIAGRGARDVVEQIGLPNLFYSFGIMHPGAITLHNYPETLRKLERNGEVKMDLAAIDILRDRERGVPRYNAFRRLMDMDAIEKFEDLSANKEWCEEIRRVYNNDLEAVDLQVGMYAEPLIPGFGFSETAFRVFLLMASRRLQSDRFFTTDYNEATYSKAGLQWIEETTMVTVLTRNIPALQPLLRNQENGFAPWPRRL
jgi:Animal haem peroxidase